MTSAPTERPTLVTIFGVLNLGFGAMGIFGTLSSLAVLFVFSGPANPVSVVMTQNEGYRVWVIASSALGSLAASVLIAAGVGLLLSRQWGRTLGIAYALYALVAAVVGLVVNVVYLVLPLVEQASTAGSAATMGAAGGAIGGIFGALVGLAYPTLLLVFMSRPAISEYLARADAARRDPSVTGA